MIYHLSGMSERVAITAREHVNQQNGYVCVSIPIFLSLLFFSLHFPFIFQVPIAEFIVSEFLPFPHSTQKQKLHRQGIRKAKHTRIYFFIYNMKSTKLKGGWYQIYSLSLGVRWAT